jgi:uncharacterized protein
MRQILIVFINAYRYILSPFMGHNCRFYPSCSCYAQDAIQEYGVTRGTWLAIRRIVKCHPWHDGGVDYLPEKVEE